MQKSSNQLHLGKALRGLSDSEGLNCQRASENRESERHITEKCISTK